ncbi:c-type cytochrome biogenesis protein CcsB [Thiohalophilus thiocyanatoxydans]|uniref:Cytochrome c-type biogenesis protein CcsB n=1 Tax=Thiohalophilus thiocyanatoxydans TaxID=381308 RepID=A0A4R8J059_9GAMM|nr:c-type cytochrome biogenesis protein CcsB [Thiohalophilus thiocyanatoxydans]TDY03667.1 cytochrome c-type biogenesis protein CcsB [Thiohalophilus thiocyanatoxydans]
MAVTKEQLNENFGKQSFFKQLSPFDWIWAAVLLFGAGFAWNKYSALMDHYEVGILFGTALALIALGWYWKATRYLMIAIAAVSLFAVSLYGNDLGQAEQNFFLMFLFSSQSATMWMSALFVMATVVYFVYLVRPNEFIGRIATAMVWVATTMGFVGLMVRWRESYLISHDIGHIPVSNLYEVFILFAIITALIYLFYEARTRTKAMGAFVLLVISASIAFLLWYHFEKGAHEIEPLVPALQSYWMKIHVPANFVGYGAFALAAMLGVLYLIRENAARGGGTSKIWMVVMNLVGLGILGYALFFVSSTVNTLIFVVSALFLLAIYYLSIQKQRVLSYFPPAETIDEVMHKSIALGFAFFTVATVLGAMWAAEAWGGYWSWDPKETWALIVWLNYAAWLHMRLTKGWRGAPLAWWAIIGLFVTTFAFLGVNMFLSGLHSYGEL